MKKKREQKMKKNRSLNKKALFINPTKLKYCKGRINKI